MTTKTNDYRELAREARSHADQTGSGNYVQCSQTELYDIADAIDALIKERDKIVKEWNGLAKLVSDNVARVVVELDTARKDAKVHREDAKKLRTERISPRPRDTKGFERRLKQIVKSEVFRSGDLDARSP